jgi:hypothetical protein
VSGTIHDHLINWKVCVGVCLGGREPWVYSAAEVWWHPSKCRLKTTHAATQCCPATHSHSLQVDIDVAGTSNSVRLDSIQTQKLQPDTG